MLEQFWKIFTSFKFKWYSNKKNSPSIQDNQGPTLTNCGQINNSGNIFNNNGDIIINESDAQVKKPDIALKLIYPESPAVVLINVSGVIAKEIKLTVVLWNMDLPDRNDPLPIPISIYDWLRPNSRGGPQRLFYDSEVNALLKKGDKLYGSVSIVSPDCLRGRTYVVYIELGKLGWYSEVEGEVSGDILIPLNFLKETREKYFQHLEALVPFEARIDIDRE